MSFLLEVSVNEGVRMDGVYQSLPVIVAIKTGDPTRKIAAHLEFTGTFRCSKVSPLGLFFARFYKSQLKSFYWNLYRYKRLLLLCEALSLLFVIDSFPEFAVI